MASDQAVEQAQQLLPYTFQDRSLLRKALTAGDEWSKDDREGNRSFAQIGDAVMQLIILGQGHQRNLTRKQQQTALNDMRNKQTCDRLARMHNLHRLVRICPRQEPIGAQPRTLKHMLYAIVGAVWLESSNHNEVAKVMATLGFVNNVEPPSSAPERPSTPDRKNSDSAGSSSSSPSTEEELRSDEEESLSDEAIFDSQLVAKNCAGEAALFESQSTPAFVEPSHLPEYVPEIWLGFLNNDPPCFGNFDNDFNLQETGIACDAMMLFPTSFSPAVPRVGINHNHASPFKPAEMMQTDGFTQTDSVMDWSVAPAAQAVEAEKACATPPKKRRRTSDKSEVQASLGMIQTYYGRESEKLESHPNRQLDMQSHGPSYEQALSSMRTIHLKELANLTTGLGDCSAMIVLQQALQSLRSSPDMHSFAICPGIDIGERIRIIRHLGLRIAHFRLEHRLHIYLLYEQVSRDKQVPDVRGFISDFHARPSNVRTKRGNPVNNERSNITDLLMQWAKSDRPMSEMDIRTERRRMDRLRVLGSRLHSMVDHWGIGVLGLLGASFTDDRLGAITNPDFAHFIELIDRFEGSAVQRLSQAAEPAVRRFLNNETASIPLRLEMTSEEDLQNIPRLSQPMLDLFEKAIQ